MKRYFECFGLIAFFISSVGFSQQKNDTISIRKNLDIAFENFQNNDSTYISIEFQEELKNSYTDVILSLKPDFFGNKSKAESLIDYYSHSKGMEEILRKFLKDTEKNWDEIFPIGGMVYMKIYFNSDNPGAMMRPNLPNKYATLLIETEPKTDAFIYLNGKLICKIAQAKNGIRVHSGKKYELEIKAANKVICKNEIILEKQEKKVNKCVIGK